MLFTKRILTIAVLLILAFSSLIILVPVVPASGGAAKTEISESFDAFSGWEASAADVDNSSWFVTLDTSGPRSLPNALMLNRGENTRGVVFIIKEFEISLVAETGVTLDFYVMAGQSDSVLVFAGAAYPDGAGDFISPTTESSTWGRHASADLLVDSEGKHKVYVAIGLNASNSGDSILVDDIELVIERASSSSGGGLLDSLKTFGRSLGFITMARNWKGGIMILISFGMFFLAIKKKFEPLLLIPIAFGIMMANIPYMVAGTEITMMSKDGGVLYFVYELGVASELFPLLIFMGVGAMTDFGPLLANPRTALLGGAAQIGIFGTLLGAVALGMIPGLNNYISFTMPEAASIAIIGGADGPTTIYTASQLAPHLLGAVAIAAYSYMALVPIIQPPIMRALTTKKERAIKMEQLREVSKFEKLMFPFIAIIACALLIPAAVPLVGMLMFGNILRESGVVGRLSDTAQNSLMNIVVILLGIVVGATMSADNFLQLRTIGILLLGLTAFSVGTGGGVLMGKLMMVLSGGKINPLIGAAGVSAVPMAARTVQKVAQDENPDNHLLMHAMGPNVAGVIGSAMAAGVMLALV